MVATAERTRTLVTSGDPETPARVPADVIFEEHDAEYLLAPELERIGQALIADCEELAHLTTADIAYCWRRKGAKHCGKAVAAKGQKVSGLTKFYAKADFVIIVAADHLRDWGLDNWQMEALIHHELLHCQVDDETGKPAPAAHDVELFIENVSRYGLWHPSLTELRVVADQLRFEGI
jgi:hypothetical protein